MITHWFPPPPVSFWWPLVFTIATLIVCAVAIVATLVRRPEEPDALTIAALYCVGFGLLAVTEFLIFLDAAFDQSLANAWSMSTDLATFFAITAAIVAVAALGAGAVLRFREERSYRQLHLAH